MDFSLILHSRLFAIVGIPLLIFLARIADVSIGTMRVIFVSRGYKLFAAVCGFFEVLIWIIAITQIMKNLTNWTYYVAYAGGFATGNYIGIAIEEKIAIGHVLIRVVTKNPLSSLMKYLKREGYGVTVHDAEGLYGTVKILFTVVPRQQIEPVVDHIKELNPQAFYTIEDVRFVNDSHPFHGGFTIPRPRFPLRWRPFRKGK